MTDLVPVLPLPQDASNTNAYASSEREVARLYEQVVPAMVEIITDRGSGSGFFVGNGHIATASHVVLDAHEIYAVTSNNAMYRAHLEKLNDTSDIAELKLDGFNNPGQEVLQFDTTGLYERNSKVFAFGYPRGVNPTFVSAGTLKSTVMAYDLVDKDATAQTYKQSSDSEKNDMLTALSRQVLAVNIHIEPGESGGPLVDANGKVVGITDFSDDNSHEVAFFTPAIEVKRLLDEKQDKFEFHVRGGSDVIRRINGDVRAPFNWRSIRFN